jgi:uncharacterized protein YacL
MLNYFRNPIYITRVFFILITTLIGYWVGRGHMPSEGPTYSLIAFAIAIIFVVFEVSTNIISSKKILLASAGLLFGLVIAWFVYPTIPTTMFASPGEDLQDAEGKSRIICNLLFGYFGIILAIKHANRFSFSRFNFIMASPSDAAKILDTSVIVDGRIKELMNARFLQGNFVVPEFVLDELQRIADSSDSKKRARGRRGLEILDEIKDVTPRLAIWEKDYPDIRDVDHKLIALAKEMGGEIVTNDYNLQKVAQLHKVHVLNINELASMLKPAAFVGEAFAIFVTREGKENHQGVGYLEDGTMVVIEDGRKFIGSEVEVQVTSILQTPAGRMIFARVSDQAAAEARARTESHRSESDPALRAVRPKEKVER